MTEQETKRCLEHEVASLIEAINLNVKTLLLQYSEQFANDSVLPSSFARNYRDALRCAFVSWFEALSWTEPEIEDEQMWAYRERFVGEFLNGTMSAEKLVEHAVSAFIDDSHRTDNESKPTQLVSVDDQITELSNATLPALEHLQYASTSAYYHCANTGLTMSIVKSS
jgi:hypothetical protein